jgi:hypothetical protein
MGLPTGDRSEPWWWLVVVLVVVFLSHRDRSRGSVHLHGPGQAHLNHTQVWLITAYPHVCPRTSHLTTRHDTGTDTGTHALPQIRARTHHPPLLPQDWSMAPTVPRRLKPLFLPAGRNPIGLPLPPPPIPQRARLNSLSPSCSMQGTHVSGVERTLLNGPRVGAACRADVSFGSGLGSLPNMWEQAIRGGLWCGC